MRRVVGQRGMRGPAAGVDLSIMASGRFTAGALGLFALAILACGARSGGATNDSASERIVESNDAAPSTDVPPSTQEIDASVEDAGRAPPTPAVRPAIGRTTVSFGDPTIRFTVPTFALRDPVAVAAGDDGGTARAVDAAIVKRLGRERTAFDRERKELPACKRPAPSEHREHEEACTYELSCEARYASEIVVSMSCAGLSDVHGAHPTKHAFGITFDLRGGVVTPVTLDALFVPGIPWAPRLRAAGAHTLQGDEVPEQVLDPALARPDFVLESAGLRMIYEDFPFVVGPQEALLPWKSVYGLKPRGVTYELAR